MAQHMNPAIAQLDEQRSEAVLKVLPAFEHEGLPCKLIKDRDDFQVDFGDVRIWIEDEVVSFFGLKAGDFIKLFVRKLKSSSDIHLLAGTSPAGQFVKLRVSEEQHQELAKVIFWYLKTHGEITTGLV